MVVFGDEGLFFIPTLLSLKTETALYFNLNKKSLPSVPTINDQATNVLSFVSGKT
jgi:hypothetical protein